jgi:hypothetical protein
MNIQATLAQNAAGQIASGQHTSQPRFLMCPPRHFAVTYSINPWMDPGAWASGGATALRDGARRACGGRSPALAP